MSLACLILAAWFPASARAATQPQEVTIESSQTCPSLVANFEATGAIEDSGTVTSTVLSPAAGPFGVTGSTLHVRSVFTGAKGTFTLLEHVVFKATDDPDIVVEQGAWRIVAGTGSYIELKGQGTLTGTCDFGAGIELITREGRVQ